MKTGGMLALALDANNLPEEYISWIIGSGVIRYWDASLADWAPLTTATYGTDYTLNYLTTGELAGYTLLTVGTVIPEPSALALSTLALMALATYRKLR